MRGFSHSSTKQKILNVLKKLHGANLKELMKHFSISEIAVRKHLSELEQRGFIEKEIVKQEIGRPYYAYTLTRKGHATFPNQYEQLPVELLKDLEAIHGIDVVHDVLEQKMKREKKKLTSNIQAKDFEQKVKEYIEFQNQNGFFIEYKQLENGDFELKNYHCPIENVAAAYRQICHNEKNVLSNIFHKSDVQLKKCIVKNAHYCQWKISKPESS